MNVWQKQTIHRLSAIGAWFWANFVAAIMVFLDRLTIRRIVIFVGMVILTFAAAQLLTIDLALVFAGDAIFYFEIATAVYLVAARGHVRQALQMIARWVRQAARNLPSVFSRLVSRQRRNTNALDRKRDADGSAHSDDEPAAWIGGACATA